MLIIIYKYKQVLDRNGGNHLRKSAFGVKLVHCLYAYIYIYIYVCVCVCVCVSMYVTSQERDL